jgi:hypothetical protein
MINDSARPSNNNDWADYWYYKTGMNIIPANTIEKKTFENWSPWQDQSIPQELHEQRKKDGEYSKGIAILPGKIWRGPFEGKYIVAIDLDNKKAIEEFVRSNTGLEELKQVTLVEQHADPNKMHIYFIVDREIPNKASDKTNTETIEKINANEIPALEVKSNSKGIMFCSPSPHENGSNRMITGTLNPKVFEAQKVEDRIFLICKKYNISYGIMNKNNYSIKIPIEDLFKAETRIVEGHNRHEAVLRVIESLIQRNKNILSLEEIKNIAYEWNQQHCLPPLDDKEFERQWKDAIKFTTKHNDKNTPNKLNSENDNNNNNGNILEADTGLLEKIKEHCIELFVDQYNVAHVSIKIDNHVEVLSLNSRRFKNLLYRLFYNETKKLNSEKIEGILNILKADAEFSGNKKKLDLRVAKTDGYTFYYDLTNNNWSVIKITPNAWSIEEGKETPNPLLFKRYSNQKTQVTPTICDKDDVFDKFMDLLNLKDKDTILLLKCYIISLFIPEIAKPILMIHGEGGSAKSTFQELIKMLVDPSIIKTLSFPRDINELIQKLSHNYIAYFDNISEIKDWISDELCRAVTGSGFSKRELFTNDEDIIYTFQRCIGFNGINLGATNADLLDRGIIIHLERIDKKNRVRIESIRKKFDEFKPQLLGYIFNILVTVLQFKKQYGEIQLPNGFNRMADFEEYAEIISRCMGYPENEFIRVYQDNIGIQIDEAIEANLLATAVLTFIRNISDDQWEGTATRLLEELNTIAENTLKINIKNHSSWIKSSNQLSRRLNEIKTNLREKGIVIERQKDNAGNKIIKICKVSPEPSYRQEAIDQAQVSKKIFDDTKQTIDQVSPKPDSENQAQKNDNGRFGDTDDTIQDMEEESIEDAAGSNNESYECYYCDRFTPTNDEAKYQKHVLNSHPEKRLYPLLSELDAFGIKPKGKRWEI